MAGAAYLIHSSWEARHATKRNPNLLSSRNSKLNRLALEQAWLELRKDNPIDELMARRKLLTTIVALVAIGDTDPAKLKRFALNAARAAVGMKPVVRKTAGKSALAPST